MSSRNGKQFHLWFNDDDWKRLETMSNVSGLSKADVLRRLVRGRPLPDVSWWKTYARLGSLGGILKLAASKFDSREILKAASEVIYIARELRRADADRRSGENRK